MIDRQQLVRVNEDTFLYKGYRICRAGDVYNPAGKNISLNRKKKRKEHISIISENDKREYIKLIYLIYSCFADETLGRNFKLVLADGNKENVSFGNIKKVAAQEKKLNDETVQLIRHSYGLDIGESKRGNMRNQYNRLYPSQRELAKQYGVSLTTIQKIMRGDY